MCNVLKYNCIKNNVYMSITFCYYYYLFHKNNFKTYISNMAPTVREATD